MSGSITITIDGKEVTAQPGQTIMEAADGAGIYIPRLCAHQDLVPHGSCRVCTVRVNGRPQAACTQPVAPNMDVESETPEMLNVRKSMVEMLYVEGSHFCPFCERSGDCELQAMAYRLGVASPRYPFMYPRRKVDASHPEILVDHNRCILCGRCVRASRDIDGKHVFDFVQRGPHKEVGVNAKSGLGGTNAAVTDKILEVCPVGAILRKGVGFKVPVGQRTYDHAPIGTDIEKQGTTSE